MAHLGQITMIDKVHCTIVFICKNNPIYEYILKCLGVYFCMPTGPIDDSFTFFVAFLCKLTKEQNYKVKFCFY